MSSDKPRLSVVGDGLVVVEFGDDGKRRKVDITSEEDREIVESVGYLHHLGHNHNARLSVELGPYEAYSLVGVLQAFIAHTDQPVIAHFARTLAESLIGSIEAGLDGDERGAAALRSLRMGWHDVNISDGDTDVSTSVPPPFGPGGYL